MLIIFYLIISASAHAAGGIALGATRIIYPADAKQIGRASCRERV